MIKVDPIIGVKDVEASSIWYQNVFGCKSMHGGSEFEILASQDDEVLICLHKWGEDEHPSMIDSDIPSGNGLILYFRADNLEDIRQHVDHVGGRVEKEIHVNPNSRKKEFSLRDPDNYYITISEYHNYGG